MRESELIAQLTAAVRATNPDDAYTTKELGAMMGLGEAAVRRRLNALKKAQRLNVVEVEREGIDGVYYKTRAYRVLSSD